MPDKSSQFVSWFRSASPYIHVHKGKTFIIQFDDNAVRCQTFANLVHDLALLNSLGVHLVLVFGARASIEASLHTQNMASTYHNNLRVTDLETMNYVKQAAGKLQIEIEAGLSMGIGNTPMANAKLRVVSGNFITAKPLGIVDGIDYQFTGEVRNIDVNSIQAKLEAREIVLIPPVGYSTTGETYNLSGTDLAARLAIELGADKLIYLMEAEGLKDKEGDLIHQLTQSDAEALLGETENSMPSYRYLGSAVNASMQGVQRVHLIDRRVDGAVLQELFTRDGAGTMISATPYDVIRGAGFEDIPGILDLIGPLEEEGVLVERPREKLELEIEYFTVLERDGVVIGCAALYPFPENNSAEIACLAVHPDYYNDGRGEQLYAHLEASSIKNGLDQLFVLTTHAEHWFLERGFTEASPDALPVERKSLYNYQRNSKALVKGL